MQQPWLFDQPRNCAAISLRQIVEGARPVLLGFMGDLTPPVPASFLNLDLELEGPSDLVPISESFGREAFALYCGETAGGYRLSVEPIIEGGLSGDAIACTEHFLRLLEALPDDCRSLLKACTTRAFDYGFDGGLEEAPLRADLGPRHLARMAALGIGARVTVYPFRRETEEKSD